MQTHRRFEAEFFSQFLNGKRFGLGKRTLADVVFGRGIKHVAFAFPEVRVEVYVEVYRPPVCFPV